jgi:hypothetical protein
VSALPSLERWMNRSQSSSACRAEVKNAAPNGNRSPDVEIERRHDGCLQTGVTNIGTLTVTILDIIQHEVSKTRFHLSLQVEPTQLSPIDRQKEVISVFGHQQKTNHQWELATDGYTSSLPDCTRQPMSNRATTSAHSFVVRSRTYKT